MDLGKAGVGDDLRQRNVFPLPEITHDEAGSHSDPFWRDLANQGIKTLNELSEGVNSSFESKTKTTRVQRRVQSQILEAFVDAYPRDSCLDHAGGLEKLCSSFRLYGSVRTDIKPYAEDNISWPQASSRPVPLGRCLNDADREWLGTWRSHMLRSDALKVQEKVVPYVDPILKNNPHEYGGFLKELHTRGMLRYRIAHGECGKLGIFFVAKKSGQLRLIFDTRLLNQDFEEPPKTDLPSADAFTRMEMPEGQQFYIGSGDLSNAFYTLSVPEELGRMFTLPCIKAQHLGLTNIGGTAVRPDTQVLPYLTVLPMGWTWALHLCQLVIMNAISAAGISDSQIIGHKRGAVRLHDPDSIAVAGYVDNFGIFGCNPSTVDQGRMRIAEQLRRWGLSVHEEEQAQLKGEFVGLFFNGARLTLVGVLMLLPLILLLGVGVCSRQLDVSTVASIGSVSERWRFKFEDATRARKHALFKNMSDDDHADRCHKQIELGSLQGSGFQYDKTEQSGIDDARSDMNASNGTDAFSTFICDQGFDEIPTDLLKPGDWAVVWSKPWKFQANILNTEARALGLSQSGRTETLSDGERILSRNPLDISAAMGMKTNTNLMPLNLEGFHAKESPKLARRRKVAASTSVPQGLTYLEMRSVRNKTVKDYQQRLDKFTTWLRGTTSKLLTPEDLDFCLVEYMNEMFLKGEGIDSGIRIHAAVRFFFPFLGRPAAGTLPRVVRALKGWSMASPPKQRLPLPVEALGAIMGKILEWGHPQLVLRLFIQFLTYLRPGELSGLTVGQMIAPQLAMAERFSTWAILLHPVEGEVPGKTGIYDATVLLDSDPWMDPLLKALIANRKPDELLWLDPHQKLVKEFSKAVTDLGLEHLGTCLYTLRHGGATHDILTRRRSMLEVKQRGRWQSDTSLRRYVKLARLQHEQSKIPKSVSEKGLQVLANLPQLLHAALPGIQPSQRECQRKLRLNRLVQR
eukprot:s2255_g11.t1